jgi:hypothetical protein
MILGRDVKGYNFWWHKKIKDFLEIDL